MIQLTYVYPCRLEKDQLRLKWAMPVYMFNGTSYPVYVDGCGYGMDLATATCLYREAMDLPHFHLEDIFVNGFARQECDGVNIVPSDLFLYEGLRPEAVRGNEVINALLYP